MELEKIQHSFTVHQAYIWLCVASMIHLYFSFPITILYICCAQTTDRLPTDRLQSMDCAAQGIDLHFVRQSMD